MKNIVGRSGILNEMCPFVFIFIVIGEGGLKKRTKKSLPTFEFETGTSECQQGDFEGECGVLAVLCVLWFLVSSEWNGKLIDLFLMRFESGLSKHW